ncbi:hypothetical protein B0O80DRAFT_465005 [Mortierella sp. GBAus27b]|nr:hypothetical protein B0O80DRAFT_465005 [Mortierella sp. GBAus27b]
MNKQHASPPPPTQPNSKKATNTQPEWTLGGEGGRRMGTQEWGDTTAALFPSP